MNPDPNLSSDRCDAFVEDLSHFVLGELQDERRPALERHLASCAACRAERDLLARSVELVKLEGATAGSPLQLSPERRTTLLSQAEASSRPRSIFTIGRLAAAAAVVAGAGLAWNAMKSRTADVGPVCEELQVARGEPAGDPASGRRYFGPPDTAPAAASGDPSNLADAMSEAERAGYVALPEAPEMEDLAEEASRAESKDTLDAMRRVTSAPEAAPPGDTFHIAPPGNTPPGNPGGPTTPQGPTGSTLLGLQPESKPAEPVVRRGAGMKAGRLGGASKRLAGAAPAPSPAAPVTGGGGGGVSRSKAGAPTQPESQAGEELRSLGYLGGSDESDDDGLDSYADPNGTYYTDDAASIAAAIPSLALVLARSNAPTDVLALEPQLSAAFRFDPNTPASREEAEANARRSSDLVREFLEQLAPRQGETPRDMFFRYFGDHPFVSTRVDAKSTFGMDVDTASYNLVRAYLTQGTLPPKAAVRTEEFVNAFRHDLAPPARDGAEVFAIRTELAPSPFGEDGALLLQVGLKARDVPKEERRPVALTFVIDVSGSMEEGGRLEMVKRALHLLVAQLDERDTIGIVTFSTDGRRALDPTNAARRGQIYSTLDALRPDGSTNADAGLRLGYDMALEQLRPNAENRVILCSDGVANTGVTDVNRMVARIRECKSKYVYLNCVGVGMNNHNDALLEQLADEGDGSCAYVDRDEEAKEIFVDKLSGTLVTVARNAKVQVEFDPRSVRRFRQLGYENRALAHRDFRNDRVDAGEVGAGHEVIALYEIELQQGAVGPLATVRARYEEPRSAEVIEQAREIFAAEGAASAGQASPRFRLTMAVAEFAEILRQSIHARSGSLADVQRFAEPLVDELPGDPDVPEFVALVKQAARLPDLLPRRTELVRAVDELKRVRCWREELRRAEELRDPAQQAANDELMRQLEEQNRKLEQALRDALERVARGS